jgi:branched-chain amino acid transport system ATP-binding protein
MSLVVEKLNAFYGPSHILHDVSLTVGEAEIVSLLGRNGAGKTTTLLSVMGYLTPQPGSIRFQGREIGGLAPHRVSRLGIGFVPQERGIFKSLTVEENLLVAARPGLAARWSLPDVYRMFPRLEERRAFRGTKLSGGEQQMLSIARALLLNPQFLILDEPSEGLAPLIVQEIIAIIRGVRDAGVAVLIIEQNMRIALAIADRHYILNKGAVTFQGSSEMLQADPSLLREQLAL